MRAKPDENLGKRAIELIEEAGHDTATVSGQHLGGTSDEDLISVCEAERRVLVTLDFSNVLRFPPQQYGGIVVLRLPHPIRLETIRRCVRVLLKASDSEDLSGRLWIAEQDRTREYSPK